MKLILYGIIIGFGKIIPGVSGSLLAVSLGVYQKAIHAVTHFYSDFKENLAFLLKLGLGIIFGIVIFSKIILYLITNYYFYSILLFIGLILSTIIRQFKKITINFPIIIITITIIIFLSLIPNINLNPNNNLTYLIGGFIEIFSSIIPGISGTSLFLSLGIYHHILELITNSLNINYLINNSIKYIYFTIGMLISLISCTLLIDYLYQKHKTLFNNIILGLSLGSIILLILLINWPVNIFNLLIGLFLFTLGIFLGLII